MVFGVDDFAILTQHTAKLCGTQYLNKTMHRSPSLHKLFLPLAN